jgi:pilus assembly protein CpaD
MRSTPVPARLAAAALLALSIGACAKQDRMVTGSVIPTDVRARHPIVLTNAPATLDIFVTGVGGLDSRQRQDVADFASAYRSAGTGSIQILAPRGAGQDAAAQRVVAAIRKELTASGAAAPIEVGSYSVADARLAAPVRVSYRKLEAKADTRCGEWPDDLGASGSKAGWDNRPYYNFGCAYQQNMAAQVADPRDLVRPRHLDPADSQMRTRAITAVREGKDPSTFWYYSPTPIGNLSP